MNLSEKIAAFRQLGQKIDQLTEDETLKLAQEASLHNAWFTHTNVQKALNGISHMLGEDKLKDWTDRYEIKSEVPKIVGIVMAGNIPLVGFQDLLCVLISGNFAAIKPSSEDAFLVQKIIDWLVELEPRFKKNIELRDKLTNTEAVIATGSDNTARYFEYYFKDIPHIIRKNRTSVAILKGDETEEELKALGNDIFSYFGLGCRNVSKTFTPAGYDLRDAFPSWESFEPIINHHKYRNNYDYYKSIYLVNKTPHLDTGFLLTVSTDDLVSPISVLYHQEYKSEIHLQNVLESFKNKIQCIVSTDHIPFGKAQHPELWDYADNVDVLEFLSELH